MNDITAEIPAKWRDVGIQLDLSNSVLDGIQSQNSNSSQRSFEQMFNEWRVSRTQKVHTHGPTLLAS